VAINILDRLPVPEQDADIVGRDGYPLLGPDGCPLVVKKYQAVMWVTLSAKDALSWDPDRGEFPVVLDTGLNHNFAITQEHWDFFCGLTPVPSGTEIEIDERPLFPKAAQVWIHRNEAGRNKLSGEEPVRLRLPEGVIVYPAGMKNPARLPTLGLRAIVRNRLKLIVDGDDKAVTLSTPA
jgi:hypothetical protein